MAHRLVGPRESKVPTEELDTAIATAEKRLSACLAKVENARAEAARWRAKANHANTTSEYSDYNPPLRAVDQNRGHSPSPERPFSRYMSSTAVRRSPVASSPSGISRGSRDSRITPKESPSTLLPSLTSRLKRYQQEADRAASEALPASASINETPAAIAHRKWEPPKGYTSPLSSTRSRSRSPPPAIMSDVHRMDGEVNREASPIESEMDLHKDEKTADQTVDEEEEGESSKLREEVEKAQQEARMELYEKTIQTLQSDIQQLKEENNELSNRLVESEYYQNLSRNMTDQSKYQRSRRMKYFIATRTHDRKISCHMAFWRWYRRTVKGRKSFLTVADAHNWVIRNWVIRRKNNVLRIWKSRLTTRRKMYIVQKCVASHHSHVVMMYKHWRWIAKSRSLQLKKYLRACVSHEVNLLRLGLKRFREFFLRCQHRRQVGIRVLGRMHSKRVQGLARDALLAMRNPSRMSKWRRAMMNVLVNRKRRERKIACLLTWRRRAAILSRKHVQRHIKDKDSVLLVKSVEMTRQAQENQQWKHEVDRLEKDVEYWRTEYEILRKSGTYSHHKSPKSISIQEKPRDTSPTPNHRPISPRLLGVPAMSSVDDSSISADKANTSLKEKHGLLEKSIESAAMSVGSFMHHEKTGHSSFTSHRSGRSYANRPAEYYLGVMRNGSFLTRYTNSEGEPCNPDRSWVCLTPDGREICIQSSTSSVGNSFSYNIPTHRLLNVEIGTASFTGSKRESVPERPWNCFSITLVDVQSKDKTIDFATPDDETLLAWVVGIYSLICTETSSIGIKERVVQKEVDRMKEKAGFLADLSLSTEFLNGSVQSALGKDSSMVAERSRVMDNSASILMKPSPVRHVVNISGAARTQATQSKGVARELFGE